LECWGRIPQQRPGARIPSHDSKRFVIFASHPSVFHSNFIKHSHLHAEIPA
jgi:hypothetical protein